MQTVKFEAVTKNELTPAEKKVVRHKMSLLELAETLGNVTKACKMKGVSRTQFYEYKRRFQTRGLEGLRDLPPIHKSHPMTTPPETVACALASCPNAPSPPCTTRFCRNTTTGEYG